MTVIYIFIKDQTSLNIFRKVSLFLWVFIFILLIVVVIIIIIVIIHLFGRSVNCS